MGAATTAPGPLTIAGRATRAALRRWPLALALYVPSTLFALLASLPLLAAADDLTRLGPWAQRLAGTDTLNSITEITTQLSGRPVPGELAAAMAGAGSSVLLGVLLLVPTSLVYNVMSGGILQQLSAGGAAGSWWSGCRQWAWPMIWFGLLANALFLPLALVGLFAVLLVPVGGTAGFVVQLLLAVGWIAFLNGLLELARASMVTRHDRHASPALGRAVRQLRAGALASALLLWLSLAVLATFYNTVAGSILLAIPTTAPVLLVATQQLAALGGAWLKLLRLSAAVELARPANNAVNQT
ncbi:MAG: hypothetical protein ACYC4L_02245 [Chloroflexota bacterium]